MKIRNLSNIFYRSRRILVDQRLLVDVINWIISPTDTIDLPVDLQALPDDVYISSIGYDARTNCLAILAHHESWDEVPRGTVVPVMEIPGGRTVMKVHVPTPEDHLMVKGEWVEPKQQRCR